MPDVSSYIKINDKISREGVVSYTPIPGIVHNHPKPDSIVCRKGVLYGMILLAWLAGAACLIYMTLIVRPACDHQGLDMKMWENYKSVHGKNYTMEEDEKRMCIFLENMKEIDYHNKLFEIGFESYKKEMNKFSDFTPEELDGMKCFQGDFKRPPSQHVFSFREGAPYPQNLDWRSKGAVTEVKNQGQCGSCYAFSATGSLEAQHFIKTGKLVSLSEQNIVDCSGPQRNRGCKGGNMMNSFRYIMQHGIDTEKFYPYEGKEGTCRFQISEVGATVTGYGSIDPFEEALKAAVVDIGPISVGIHVSKNFFQYKTGIFQEDNCDPYDLNHAVLVVGYGIDGDQDYWLVKNSWDKTWGEDGYIRMARNQGNMCGIATMASFPFP
ncbi:unnamed protein product [Nezara viridula]|uniref:Uncharacterized protein n=1 Tax=Nezara viridula TaxID=85310 RepID=A0A9P0MQJ0_NEZVI|nr:unnamed protein product [Nezara viridula]